MRLFDSHAHLSDARFAQDRDEMIRGLAARGVEGVIECATDAADIEEVAALAETYGNVYAAVGIHPHSCDEFTPEVAARLRQLYAREKVVAIGEIGLDYHYDFCPRGMQRETLKQQLMLARELDAPVILHCREATADMLAVLEEVGYYYGVMHCFSGSAETAELLLKKGMYLGFGGSLTFKNNVKTVRAAEVTPIDRILLETDSPYLAPVPMRGKRNEPAYTGYVAQRLGEIKGLAAEEVAQAALENTRQLFRI